MPEQCSLKIAPKGIGVMPNTAAAGNKSSLRFEGMLQGF